MIVRARFFTIASAVFFVITCDVSFLGCRSPLARCNSEGASACACAAGLEMTKSDVVANAKQTGLRTEARYAGNRDVRQAFFSGDFGSPPSQATARLHYMRIINVGEKSSAEMQQRYSIATAVDGVNRWENCRAQTKAAKQFARAPCRDGAGVVAQFGPHQSRARRSFCGRKANGK